MSTDAASSSASEPPTHEGVPHPLDRVIWRALHGPHRSLAEGDERACRYPAAVAPFAAIADLEPDAFASLDSLIGPGGDQIALLSTAPLQPPPTFAILRQEPIDQMILSDPDACSAPATAALTRLGPTDAVAMVALARLTQPGPFGPRTIELGTYLGAWRDGMLAAMAGERMRTEGFTEISAVCVHPAHRGHGLAADLVRTLAASILARAQTPFLHVFRANAQAVALYRKLGFSLRREMHLTVLSRAGSAVHDDL